MRRLPKKCRACGYDLRRHRSGDRCPECGRPHREIAAWREWLRDCLSWRSFVFLGALGAPIVVAGVDVRSSRAQAFAILLVVMAGGLLVPAFWGHARGLDRWLASTLLGLMVVASAVLLLWAIGAVR